MKLAIGSDHAGFSYKEAIKTMLEAEGHSVRDFGTNSDAPVDYPDFIRPVAEAVAGGVVERGIVLGGSGNGEAIVTNKVRGIRAALCTDAQTAAGARKWNDANVLGLSLRSLSEPVAKEIVDAWLDASYAGSEDASLEVIRRTERG